MRLWAPVSMLALIPILSDYLLNRSQLSVQEILLPLLLNLAIAIIVTSLFYRTWRHNSLVGFMAATITIIILVNSYEVRLTAIEPVLRALAPLPGLGGYEFTLYSLALMVIIGGGAYWVGRLANAIVARRSWSAASIITALTIAISATFVIQFAATANDLSSAWPQFFYKPPHLAAAPAAAKTAAKPDIYYIVMDDYASSENLKSQFNFDNSDFTNFLSANNYYVRDNAHQNYPYTAMSIASTLNADYNRDIVTKFGSSKYQTTIPYNLATRNSSVAQYLKSVGYQYKLLGNWYETSNDSVLANTSFQEEGQLTLLGRTFTLDNFAKNELGQGIFWHFLPAKLTIGGFNLLGYKNVDGAQLTLDQFKTLKSIVAQPAGGRFIFAHFLVPHDPYFFNADGSFSMSNNGDNFAEPIKEKYVNQVQFVNSQIRTILSDIKTNSHGQAVVVLQSDEGPHPQDLNNGDFDFTSIQDELSSGSMLTWSGKDLQLKYGSFAAYNVPGASQADLVAGGTNVNAFRLVINTLFNQKLPYLPDCYYAYPNGRSRPFYYKNINQQLTGTATPACGSDGSGPKS